MQNRNRKRVSAEVKRSALVGAMLGLLAFTVMVLGVFGFMLAGRMGGEPVTDPVTEPMTEPVTDPVTDPISVPVTDPATDPVTEPVTDPVTEPAEKRVSFVACGDNIVHDAVREDAQKRANAENPNFNFYDMYAGVADIIGAADVSFINMEGCVGGASLGYLGYPNFNAPNEIGEAFVKLGFDVVNLLNNHTLDYDEIGYKNTIAYFEDLPVLTIGGYKKSDYDNLRIIDRNGIKIAFLSYTTIMNYDSATWLPRKLPANSEYLISNAEDAAIKRQIALAREAADFVVVSMHWGDEDAYKPNSEQKRLARLCADMGADVVVGHHSHTVQPAEWLTGADGNKTFVAYSLGNFISTMHYSQNMAGAMLSLDFVIDENGEGHVEAPKLIPTVTHYSLKRDALQIYRMSDYSEALAKTHGSTLQNSFSYAILKKYITDALDDEFIEW